MEGIGVEQIGIKLNKKKKGKEKMENERKDERVECIHIGCSYLKSMFACSVIFLARFRIDRDVKHECINHDTLSLAQRKKRFPLRSNKGSI